MEVFAAVAVGIVAGVLIKALFLKDSSLMWDVALGATGGLAAYFLANTLSESIYGYVATLGTAVVIAGVLTGIVAKFGRTTV